MKAKCSYCGGDGWIIEQVGVDRYGDAVGEQVQCRWCEGTGFIDEEVQDEGK